MLYPTYKIKKPIRLIELFAGYGSQALALKYLGVKEHTIRFYNAPCYLKRINDRKDRYDVIKVEGS